MPTPPEPILYVDLDGTLVATDLLHESFLAALKRSPWNAVRSLGWLLMGRNRLKEEVAARGELDVALLPYRDSVLAFLREERARGRRIVLATASWSGLADAVALHLGLFDEVLATSREGNFKGEAKARLFVERCGAKNYDYIGDNAADFPIWAQARHAYVVDVTGRMVRRMPAGVDVKHVFPLDAPGPRWRYALRALRPHQWAKHLIVFIPLIAAHRLLDPHAFSATVLAIAAFCMVASSGYLLYDLLDLAADRSHPRKRRRPLASGLLSIPAGIALFAATLAAGAAIAAFLPWEFQATLAAYFVLTLAYSFKLKRIVMLDVIALAGFYTLRIVAGSFAIAAAISFWLVTFSMFLFFSLALVKRYAEVLALADDGIRDMPGRGYRGQDGQLILALGTASAMVSALVLALYINGETVKSLYAHPDMLWLLCPLLLYWISRMWLLATRNQMNEDPVLFAIRDGASYYIAAVGALVLWLAT
jgi:4-hydroxybenzoate polyprenyltransferase/phosphoserine phosphatase